MASADAMSPPRRREGADTYRPARKERSPPPVPVKTEEEKQAAAKAEYEKLLTMRSGGTYIPPARLRALQAQITDKSSKEYQRMAWEALKKSINGLINKVNVANIKALAPELFNENLIRGRGLYCQSIIKAQHASLPFTPIYAAVTAIINTKLPQVGELLVRRLVLRFRKAFRRNDKAVCLSSTMFIAHLVNTQLVHEMLAAQILLLLLKKPTDDSVEIAVGLTREVGKFLEEMNPTISNVVFDQFRNILHEADIDKRVQYMVEVLFQIRKDRFKDNPIIKEELDLVEEEDQITHHVDLDADIDAEDRLNIFKFDEEYEAHEEDYKRLKAEILGEGSDYEDDDDESESESEEEDEEQKAVEIKDQTNADLVNLRRTVYLTIMSSADPEEATHKLMKLRLPPGQEPELVSMVIESCAQEKTYLKFFGLIGERFARLNRMWMDLFEEAFVKYYETIHRYETNKLRNIARFFGHLLASDSIGWHVLSVVHMNEDETTSASRIFIRILFEDIQEDIGAAKLKARMSDDTLQPSFQGLFPHDTPRNVRFSINYFTSIKMGYLTEEMRTFLQNMPKPALPAATAGDRSDSDSDSVSSYSSYTGSSYSSRSRSRSVDSRRAINRGRSTSRTPPRRFRGRSGSRGRSSTRSPSRSQSGSPRRGRKDSRSASPRRATAQRDSSYSRSPSPPPRQQRRGRDRSLSDSRSPRGRDRSASSLSRSPPPRRQEQRRNAPPDRNRSYSRSASPPAKRTARYRSVSGSPPPQARRRNSSSVSSAPRRRRDASSSASPPPQRRRRNSSSVSAAPRKRMGSYSRSPSPVGVGKRRRAYSSSRSRSPVPPKRGRRSS